MDALTAQPSRTFKRWVNNPANPTSGVLVPVVFTIRGDLQKAESLLYMAPGVLQKMRYENAQHLPDYRKVVTVGGDGGRWEATIISQTQFGVESITIYVPTLPKGLPPKVEERTTVMYVPTFEIRDASNVVTGYVMSYHHWGGAYEYISADDLLTTLHNFYDESWWYENDGVTPFEDGEPKEELLYSQITGDSDNFTKREIFNIPCLAEKLLSTQSSSTGVSTGVYDDTCQDVWCDFCDDPINPYYGVMVNYLGHIEDTTTTTYSMLSYESYDDWYNEVNGQSILTRESLPRNHGGGWAGGVGLAAAGTCDDTALAILQAWVDANCPPPTTPTWIPTNYDSNIWREATTWYDVTGTSISSQSSSASYEQGNRGCHLWGGIENSYYASMIATIEECDVDRFPNVTWTETDGVWTLAFSEYFTVNGQDNLVLHVDADYYDYQPQYCSVRWYQLSDNVDGSVIALGALRRRSGGDTNSRYEYIYCSDSGGNQHFSTTWFTDIVSLEHLIPDVTDNDNNAVYAAGEFRLFKIVTTTKTTIPAPL